MTRQRNGKEGQPANLFNPIDVKVTLLFTKRQKVLRELQTKSKIAAIKLHKQLYGSTLVEAHEFVKRLEGGPTDEAKDYSETVKRTDPGATR